MALGGPVPLGRPELPQKLQRLGKAICDRADKFLKFFKSNATPNSPLLQRYLSESGGRWGNTATRQLNDRIATDLKNRGYDITGGEGRASEEWFAGPGGGTKGGTFVDITATKGSQTVRIQTVTTLADGVTPTASELAAAARILARFANDQLILVSKTTGQVIP